MSYVIPAEHHEGDRGGQECEGDQRGKIECEATLGLTYDSLGGRSVGFAHALLERRVVAVGFQEHGAESRRQRQGVERRDTDGDSHRQTELTVEHARGAGHERYGDKHEHHHQSDRYDGAAYLAHGVDGCAARALVADIELGVDSLHHHYRVVDHNRDRKHESRQSDEVDREADEVHEEERTHKSHRDRDGRDDRGADILQEHIHHEEHQDERLDEGLDHLMDRGIEEVVVVHRYRYLQTRGKLALHLLDLGQTVVDDLCGVGAGGLEDDTRRGHLAVERVGESVGQTSQLHFGHITQTEYLAGGLGGHHYILELLGSGQTAFILHRVLEALVALFAERTRSGLDILLRKSVCDIRRHQAILGHHLGLEPYTHRVVGTERHDVAHARHTLQLGNDIDLGIVVDKLHRVVARSVVERHHQKHRRLTLGCLHTHLSHLGGKQVESLRHTVLHVDGSHVGIKALLEIHCDVGRAGVGGGRLHVGHALGAVDRLLKRSYHGVEHSLGVGALICGRHAYRRRRYVGKLGHRQREEADQTQQHDEYRDYRRQHRAVNERI